MNPDAALLTGNRPLIKYGTGTLTITGTATYTGGTTIAAGTLQLGNGKPTEKSPATSSTTAPLRSTILLRTHFRAPFPAAAE